MSINNQSFEDAKTKANERLESWIAEAKSERGLDNLHSKFGQTFKKIKYNSGQYKDRADRTEKDKSSDTKSRIKVRKKHTRGRRDSANLIYGENRNCSRASLKGCRPSTRDSDLMLASDGVATTADVQDISKAAIQKFKDDIKPDGSLTIAGDKSQTCLEERNVIKSPAFPVIQIRGSSSSNMQVDGCPVIGVPNNANAGQLDKGGGNALIQRHRPIITVVDGVKDKWLATEEKVKLTARESKRTIWKTSGALEAINLRQSPSVRQPISPSTVGSGMHIADKKSRPGLADICVSMVHSKTVVRQRSARFERRRRGKQCVRLKTLGKKIACVMRLIKGCKEALKRSEMDDRTLFAKDSGHIDFDTSQFSPERCQNRISKKEKSILRIVPEYRTEGHLEALKKVVYRLPMFFKYSRKIKKELARYLFYDQYEAGRVMVRQGDVGQYMYFIISGSVSVYQMLLDDDGNKIGKHLLDLTSGSSFGKIALMKDTERIATIVCKGTSEFLILDKNEFKTILSEKFENEYKRIRRFFSQTPYFEHWPEEETDILIHTAELRDYTYDQVLLGNVTGLTDKLYFIRKGQVDIVKTVFYTREKKQYWPDVLHPTCSTEQHEALSNIYSGTNEVTDGGKFMRHLVVGCLKSGDYFGAGENLKNVHYVTRGKAQIISVSSARYEISGRNEELRNMAERRNEEIPSTKEANRKYMWSRKWFLYKRNLVNEIKNRRKIPLTTKLSDVPRFCIEEPRINLSNF